MRHAKLQHFIQELEVVLRDKQKQLLLELRSQLTGMLHTQPFTIYDDATIERLLDAQPKTIKELAEVKGFPVNGKRINGFGESVIAIFSKTDRIKKIVVKGSAGSPSINTEMKEMSVF
jgi:HRDC domain.